MLRRANLYLPSFWPLLKLDWNLGKSGEKSRVGLEEARFGICALLNIQRIL